MPDLQYNLFFEDGGSLDKMIDKVTTLRDTIKNTDTDLSAAGVTDVGREQVVRELDSAEAYLKDISKLHVFDDGIPSYYLSSLSYLSSELKKIDQTLGHIKSSKDKLITNSEKQTMAGSFWNSVFAISSLAGNAGEIYSKNKSPNNAIARARTMMTRIKSKSIDVGFDAETFEAIAPVLAQLHMKDIIQNERNTGNATNEGILSALRTNKVLRRAVNNMAQDTGMIERNGSKYLTDEQYANLIEAVAETYTNLGTNLDIYNRWAKNRERHLTGKEAPTRFISQRLDSRLMNTFSSYGKNIEVQEKLNDAAFKKILNQSVDTQSDPRLELLKSILSSRKDYMKELGPLMQEAGIGVVRSRNTGKNPLEYEFFRDTSTKQWMYLAGRVLQKYHDALSSDMIYEKNPENIGDLDVVGKRQGKKPTMWLTVANALSEFTPSVDVMSPNSIKGKGGYVSTGIKYEKSPVLERYFIPQVGYDEEGNLQRTVDYYWQKPIKQEGITERKTDPLVARTRSIFTDMFQMKGNGTMGWGRDDYGIAIRPDASVGRVAPLISLRLDQLLSPNPNKQAAMSEAYIFDENDPRLKEMEQYLSRKKDYMLDGQAYRYISQNNDAATFGLASLVDAYEEFYASLGMPSPFNYGNAVDMFKLDLKESKITKQINNIRKGFSSAVPLEEAYEDAKNIFEDGRHIAYVNMDMLYDYIETLPGQKGKWGKGVRSDGQVWGDPRFFKRDMQMRFALGSDKFMMTPYDFKNDFMELWKANAKRDKKDQNNLMFGYDENGNPALWAPSGMNFDKDYDEIAQYYAGALSDKEAENIRKTRMVNLLDENAVMLMSNSAVKSAQQFGVLTVEQYKRQFGGKSPQKAYNEALREGRLVDQYLNPINPKKTDVPESMQFIRLNPTQSEQYMRLYGSAYATFDPYTKKRIKDELNRSGLEVMKNENDMLSDKNFMPESFLRAANADPEIFRRSEALYRELEESLDTYSGRVAQFINDEGAMEKINSDYNWVFNDPEANHRIDQIRKELHYRHATNQVMLEKPREGAVAVETLGDLTRAFMLASGIQPEEISRELRASLPESFAKLDSYGNPVINKGQRVWAPSFSEMTISALTRFPTGTGQMALNVYNAAQDPKVREYFKLEKEQGDRSSKINRLKKKIKEEKNAEKSAALRAELTKEEEARTKASERMSFLRTKSDENTQWGIDFGLQLKKSGRNEDIFSSSGVIATARTLHSMNTGDFDGDTINAFYGLSEEFVKRAEEEAIAVRKQAAELKAEEDRMQKTNVDTVKMSEGRRKLEAMRRHANSVAAMGTASAALRKAQTADATEFDRATGIVQALNAYDFATSEVQNEGQPFNLGKVAQKYLASQGAHYERLMKFIHESEENPEEYAKKNIFKYSMMTTTDPEGIYALATMAKDKAARGFVDTESFRKYEKWFSKAYGITDTSKEAKAARWYLSKMEDLNLFGKLITRKDQDEAREYAASWREDLNRRYEAKQISENDEEWERLTQFENRVKEINGKNAATVENITKLRDRNKNLYASTGNETYNEYANYLDSILRQNELAEKVDNLKNMSPKQRQKALASIAQQSSLNAIRSEQWKEQNEALRLRQEVLSSETSQEEQRKRIASDYSYEAKKAAESTASEGPMLYNWSNLKHFIRYNESDKTIPLHGISVKNLQTGLIENSEAEEAPRYDVGPSKEIQLQKDILLQLKGKSDRTSANQNPYTHIGQLMHYALEAYQTSHVASGMNPMSIEDTLNTLEQMLTGDKDDSKGSRKILNDKLGLFFSRDKATGRFTVTSRTDSMKTYTQGLEEHLNNLFGTYEMTENGRQHIRGSLESFLTDMKKSGEKLYAYEGKKYVDGKEINGFGRDVFQNVVYRKNKDGTYEVDEKRSRASLSPNDFDAQLTEEEKAAGWKVSSFRTHTKPDYVTINDQGKLKIYDYKSGQKGSIESLPQSAFYGDIYYDLAKTYWETKRQYDEAVKANNETAIKSLSQKMDSYEKYKEFADEAGNRNYEAMIGFDPKGSGYTYSLPMSNLMEGPTATYKNDVLKAYLNLHDIAASGMGTAAAELAAADLGLVTVRDEQEYRKQVEEFRKPENSKTLEFFLAQFQGQKDALEKLTSSTWSEYFKLHPNEGTRKSSRFERIDEQLDQLFSDQMMAAVEAHYGDNEAVKEELRKYQDMKVQARIRNASNAKQAAIQDLIDVQSNIFRDLHNVQPTLASNKITKAYKDLNEAALTRDYLTKDEMYYKNGQWLTNPGDQSESEKRRAEEAEWRKKIFERSEEEEKKAREFLTKESEAYIDKYINSENKNISRITSGKIEDPVKIFTDAVEKKREELERLIEQYNENVKEYEKEIQAADQKGDVVASLNLKRMQTQDKQSAKALSEYLLSNGEFEQQQRRTEEERLGLRIKENKTPAEQRARYLNAIEQQTKEKLDEKSSKFADLSSNRDKKLDEYYNEKLKEINEEKDFAQKEYNSSREKRKSALADWKKAEQERKKFETEHDTYIAEGKTEEDYQKELQKKKDEEDRLHLLHKAAIAERKQRKDQLDIISAKENYIKSDEGKKEYKEKVAAAKYDEDFNRTQREVENAKNELEEIQRMREKLPGLAKQDFDLRGSERNRRINLDATFGNRKLTLSEMQTQYYNSFLEAREKEAQLIAEQFGGKTGEAAAQAYRDKYSEDLLKTTAAQKANFEYRQQIQQEQLNQRAVNAELEGRGLTRVEKVGQKYTDLQMKRDQIADAILKRDGFAAMQDYLARYNNPYLLNTAMQEVNMGMNLAEGNRKYELETLLNRSDLADQQRKHQYAQQRRNLPGLQKGRLLTAYYQQADQAFALQQTIDKDTKERDALIALRDTKESEFIKKYGVASKDYKGDDEAARNMAQDIAKANVQISNYNNEIADAQKQSRSFVPGLMAMRAGFSAVSQSVSMMLRRFGRQMFMKALNEAKRFVKEFNASMTTIQMITLKSDEQMSKIGDGLIAKAKDLKISISEITKSAEILYRQGLSDQEVNERLDVIAKFSKVSGTKTEAATKLITVAMNTGLVSSPQEAADIVTALGDNAATNAAEIEKGIEKAGAAAAADGTSFGQLAAMLTAITSTTQIGGNVAGRTLNTIFGRMNKIGTNELIYDENGHAISGSAVAKLLDKQGIKMYDAQGNKRSSFDILYALSQKWDRMSDAEQQQMANAIAGTRQYSNFSAIMQGMSEGKIDEYMALIGESSGITNQKYEIYTKSLQAALDNLKNTFDELVNDLTKSGFLQDAIGFITKLISGVDNLSNSFGGLHAVLTTVLPLLIGLTLLKSGSPTAMLAGAAIAGVGILSAYNASNKQTEMDKFNSIVEEYDKDKSTRSSDMDRLKSLKENENRTQEEDNEYVNLINKYARETGLMASATDSSIYSISNLKKSIEGLGTVADETAQKILDESTEEEKKRKASEILKVNANVDFDKSIKDKLNSDADEDTQNDEVSYNNKILNSLLWEHTGNGMQMRKNAYIYGRSDIGYHYSEEAKLAEELDESGWLLTKLGVAAFNLFGKDTGQIGKISIANADNAYIKLLAYASSAGMLDEKYNQLSEDEIRKLYFNNMTVEERKTQLQKASDFYFEQHPYMDYNEELKATVRKEYEDILTPLLGDLYEKEDLDYLIDYATDIAYTTGDLGAGYNAIIDRNETELDKILAKANKLVSDRNIKKKDQTAVTLGIEEPGENDYFIDENGKIHTWQEIKERDQQAKIKAIRKYNDTILEKYEEDLTLFITDEEGKSVFEYYKEHNGWDENYEDLDESQRRWYKKKYYENASEDKQKEIVARDRDLANELIGGVDATEEALIKLIESGDEMLEKATEEINEATEEIKKETDTYKLQTNGFITAVENSQTTWLEANKGKTGSDSILSLLLTNDYSGPEGLKKLQLDINRLGLTEEWQNTVNANTELQDALAGVMFDEKGMVNYAPEGTVDKVITALKNSGYAYGAEQKTPFEQDLSADLAIDKLNKKAYLSAAEKEQALNEAWTKYTSEYEERIAAINKKYDAEREKVEIDEATGKQNEEDLKAIEKERESELTKLKEEYEYIDNRKGYLSSEQKDIYNRDVLSKDEISALQAVYGNRLANAYINEVVNGKSMSENEKRIFGYKQQNANIGILNGLTTDQARYEAQQIIKEAEAGRLNEYLEDLDETALNAAKQTSSSLQKYLSLSQTEKESDLGEKLLANAKVELNIAPTKDLEEAGLLSQGLANSLETINKYKDTSIAIKEQIKLEKEAYQSGQLYAQLHNGTISQRDKAVMQILNIDEQQYYSDPEYYLQEAYSAADKEREESIRDWKYRLDNAKTPYERNLVNTEVAQRGGYISYMELPNGYTVDDSGIVYKATFDEDGNFIGNVQDEDITNKYLKSAEIVLPNFNDATVGNNDYFAGKEIKYNDYQLAEARRRMLEGENLKDVDYDLYLAAASSMGTNGYEYFRQKYNYDNNRGSAPSEDLLNLAKMEEEEARRSLVRSSYSNFTDLQRASVAINGPDTDNNRKIIASALELSEEEVARMMKQEGRKDLKDRLAKVSNNLVAKVVNNLESSFEGLDLGNPQDTQALLSTLREKALTAKGQLKEDLEMWIDFLEGLPEIASVSEAYEEAQTGFEVARGKREQFNWLKENIDNVKNMQTGTWIDTEPVYNNGAFEFNLHEGVTFADNLRTASENNSQLRDILSEHHEIVAAANAYNEGTLDKTGFNAIVDYAQYGVKTPELTGSLVNALFGGTGFVDANGMFDIAKIQESPEEFIKQMQGLEESTDGARELLEILFDLVPALKEFYQTGGDENEAAEALNDFNSEMTSDKVNNVTKYTKANKNLANALSLVKKGGKDAAEGMALLRKNARDYQDQATALAKAQNQDGTYKAGKNLDESTRNVIASMFDNVSAEDLLDYSSEQMADLLDPMQDYLDQKFTDDISAIIANAGPEVNLGQLHAVVTGEMDLSELNEATRQVYEEVMAMLLEMGGDYGQIEFITDEDGNIVNLRAKVTPNKKGTYSRGGAGGKSGGGGKSEVDKLLEAQKRKLAPIEHESKMLEIKEKYYDFVNDYGAYDTNIDDQIATQERLRAAYAQNIQEMNAMLAKTQQGSDDWYKLKDAIMAAEEAMESVTNTINELNQKRISALEQKQTNEDKPDVHALTMLQKRAAKYQRSGQFEAYDITMQQTIDLTRDQITQNNKQIKEWEDLLKTYQEGSDSWIETRDKIWALKEENAELENQMASDLIDLQEARIAQIAKDLENAQAPFEHANAMLDTFGQMYQSTRNQAGYRGTLEDTIENNKRLKVLNDTAIEELKKQIDGMKESDPARENAISTLYQLEEASAKYEASILSNRQAIEESLINEVKDYHGENNAVLEHELKLLSEKEKEYSRNNDYINHENILGEKARAVGEQLAEQKAALEDYIELQNSGRITQGSEQWKELEETIRSTKESVYELTNAEREALDAFEQAQFANLQKMYKEGYGSFVGMDQLNHERTLIQYKQNGYQNNGELTNYGIALGWEKNVLIEERQAIMSQIEAVEELQKLHKDNPELYYQETEELRKLEEQLQKNTNDYDKLTEAEKKNINAILATISAVKKTADSAIRETVQKEKQMLSATITMQNSILEVIRKNFQEQWALEKKTIEKKKQALAEEKNLITERMNFRKKMMDQEAKDEELAELKRQLVLISADSTRTKEANELRRKINEMEKQAAIQTAEDIANAEIKSIEDRTQAMNDYVTVYEEDLSNLLKNANNFVEIIDGLLGGSFEDFIEWNAKYNETYKTATEEQRLQMRQSWEDSWREMLGQLKLYWEEADEVSRSKESWLALATSTDSFKSLSASDQQIRLNELSDQYDAMIKAQINNAEFDDTHNILTTLSDMKDWVFNVNIIGLEDYLISSKYSDYVYNRDRSIGDTSDTHDNYAGVGYVAPASTPSSGGGGGGSSSGSGSGSSGGGSKGSLIDWINNSSSSLPSGVTTWDVVANNNGAYGVVEVHNSSGRFASRDEAKAYADEMNASSLAQKFNSFGFDTDSKDVLESTEELLQNIKARMKYKEQNISKYAEGGLVDYTGPAWVDGTKTHPESFLDATDTQLLRDMLDSFNYVKTTPYMTHLDSSNFGKGGISVGDVNVNLYEAKLENDADYELIAQKVGKAFTKELQKDGFNLAGYAW